MTCQTPIVETLRRHGVRITPQREIILETLCHSPRHLSAEEVFTKVGRRLPGLNIATVYRTLEMLRDAKVVSMSRGAQGRAAFEVIHDGENHHHLVCESCGSTIETEAALFDGLRDLLSRKYGFAANAQHLTFTGRCKDCRDG